MSKHPFSVRRFIHIAHTGSVAAGVILGLMSGAAGNADEMLLRGICGGICGFIVSGFVYLWIIARDLNAIEISDEELNE